MAGRVGSSKARLAMRIEDWPTEDRNAWTQAMHDGGLWENSGAGSNWSDSHRDHIAWGYGRWLGYLQSINALDNPKPANRVNRQRINDYVQTLKESVKSRAVSNYIKHLCDALRIMGYSQDLRWLNEINASLQRQVQPSIPKRPRLRDSKALYELGISLMEEAKRIEPSSKLRPAMQYRDGLMIALLATRPLRRRTLASIRVGKQLIRVNGDWWLIFAGADVKTGRPIEFEWPQALTPWLEDYLEHWWPHFRNIKSHKALWASRNGTPMGGTALNVRICHYTEKAFGTSISVHLFRDCVATTIAQRDPAHVGTARELLGHSRLDTTHQHYIHAGSLEASRIHSEAIRDLRSRLARPTVEAD